MSTINNAPALVAAPAATEQVYACTREGCRCRMIAEAGWASVDDLAKAGGDLTRVVRCHTHRKPGDKKARAAMAAFKAKPAARTPQPHRPPAAPVFSNGSNGAVNRGIKAVAAARWEAANPGKPAVPHRERERIFKEETLPRIAAVIEAYAEAGIPLPRRSNTAAAAK